MSPPAPTNEPTAGRYRHLLVSPDDGSALSLHESGGQWALLAEGTGLLHPVIDDIVVLLSREDRFYELEVPAVQAFLGEGVTPELVEAARKTMELLEARQGQRSFPWEDEESWSRRYEREAAEAPDEKEWNDRVGQREQVINAAKVSGVVTLVDVGCGKGQNFRSLFKGRVAPESVYVAVDISMKGLRLTREANAWPNSLHILGSADRLPLARQSVNLICYFGILHHSQKKEKNLPEHLDLLKPGGHMILCEAVTRPRVLSRKFLPEQSAHEERFDVRDLAAQIAQQKDKVKVVFWRMRLSVFMTATGRLLGSRPFLWRPSYEVLSFMDRLCIGILGPVFPCFRGGEVLAALVRTA